VNGYRILTKSKERRFQFSVTLTQTQQITIANNNCN